MSEVKVNKISPRTNCGTVQLGDSGDTITIPAGATITNNGTQTGFGRTGTVDWNTTPKTSDFTAVNGDGFFVNTTSGAITATLPAGSAGAIVAFADYANTFDTNALRISPNGSDKIGGTNAAALVSTEGASTTFVFVDSTQGWKQVNDATLNTVGATFITATGGTITTSGDYKIHTFTGPGTFCVSQLATAPANNEVSYIVVAGGGGGGAGDFAPSLPERSGGGGGAGGFRESKSGVDCYSASPLEGATNISVTASAFPISVGGGGAKAPMPITANGTPGNNSVFSTVTSAGGGGGESAHNPSSSSGGPGGSGGGGSSGGGSSGGGGTGNTPPVSPPQGRNGGSGSTNPGQGGDGGGGATAVGGVGGGPSPPSPNSPGGPGGAGATTSITGSPVAYAGGGGGGGGSSSPPTTGGTGGTGGGGAGANNPGSAGTAGTNGLGGGGGGGAASGGAAHCAGNGGDGVVIIRYKFQ